MNIKKILILLAWAAGIIFPMAWLGTQNQAFGAWFNTVFRPAWMHVAMHSLLYAVLAALAAWILSKPGQRLPLLAVAGLCLAVALLQEGLQAVTTDPFSVGGIGYDLLVDATGATIGAFGFTLLRWARLRGQTR